MSDKSRIEYDPSPQPFTREIIGPSNRRNTITFFAPAVGRVTLSTDPVLADGAGMVLTAGQAPLTLDYDEHGEVVRYSWHALYSAGASGVGWVQSLP
jgi:hypothetical protein